MSDTKVYTITIMFTDRTSSVEKAYNYNYDYAQFTYRDVFGAFNLVPLFNVQSINVEEDDD